MKRIPNIAGTLVLSILFSCAPQSDRAQQITPDQEAAIDAIFTYFDGPDTPGAAIAVLQDGNLLFSKGYGSANLEYRIPVSPDETIFHVASVSKQFTDYAILLLEAEGKLSLDDPIQKYIPEVPDFGTPITLRHLATHTSGMRDQWDLLQLAGWRFDDVITRDHVLKIVSRQKDLNFPPGSEYLYCNTGFTLLAETVARVSGTSFDAFTLERMFKPLGMDHSFFYEDHERIVPNRAYSYSNNGESWEKSVLSYANAGATSLFTTAEDLCLWADHLNNPPDAQTRALVEKLNTLAVLNDGETFGGAYGQFVNTYKGLEKIEHSGGDAGYRSYLGRFPQQQFAVAVVSNNADANPGGLAMQVADLLLADQMTEAPTADVPADTEVITLEEDALKAFEGYYWFEEGMTYRQIYLKEGELMYNRAGGFENRLAPIGPSSFKMLDIGVDAVVEFSGEGAEKALEFKDPGGNTTRMETFEYIEPDTTVLGEYAGTYYSPELDTSYELVLAGDSLVARHNRHPDTPVKYLRKDDLGIGFTGAHMVRDGSGTITSMLVTTGRVRNLVFVKK